MKQMKVKDPVKKKFETEILFINLYEPVKVSFFVHKS